MNRPRSLVSIAASITVAAALSVLPAGVVAQQPTPSPHLTPVKGATIPAFDAEGLDGKVQKIAFDKGSTVLLFFLSSCPTCHKMIPEWNRMYERRPKGLNVIGVIMDREPPGFFSTMPIAFPVVRSPGRQFTSAHHIERVPLTLRVGAGGKVEDVAMGIIDPIKLGEIFRP
jgi:hypothetical protein